MESDTLPNAAISLPLQLPLAPTNFGAATWLLRLSGLVL